MKILAVADEECKALWDYFTPDKLEGVELIIACGDLSRHYLEYLATMAPVRRRASSAWMTTCTYTTACASPGWAAAAATAPAPGSLPRPR